MKLPKILNHKKLIGFIAILIVLGFVFRGQIKAKINPKPTYKTATVEKKTLEKTVSASGKVKAEEEAVVKFQTSGYLNWVGVKKGDKVKKWQAIASLDKEQLEKELKQELLDYMNNRWDFEKDWHDNPNSYNVDWDIRQALQKAQFDLDRTVLDVEIKNLAIKYATLWTPIDGIVTAIDMPNAGVNITAAGATFTVSNPDKLIFSAKVDEADIGGVKVGQAAKITLDAYPDQTIDSQVSKVEFTSTTTSSGGTAYEVKFSLPLNAEEKFKIGMNGDISIILAQEPNVLSVPYEAVQEKNGDKYVWVLENGRPAKKTVKIGFSTDADTQILEGVKEEQLIITSDFKNLEKFAKP